MQEPVFDIFGERSRLAATNVENRKTSSSYGCSTNPYKGVMKQKSKSVSSSTSTKRVLGDVGNTMKSTCMQKENVHLQKPTHVKETIKPPILKLNGETLTIDKASVCTPLIFKTPGRKMLKKCKNTFNIDPDLPSPNNIYFDADEINDEYLDICPKEEQLSTEDIYNLTNIWNKPNKLMDLDCDLDFTSTFPIIEDEIISGVLDCDGCGNDSEFKKFIYNLPTF